MITDWKTSLLGSVATLQRGYDLPHRVRKPGSIPIVTSSGFESHHSEAKVKAPGVVTGRYGTIGEVFYVRDDFWPLNTTLYVRNFHDNDPLFVSYLLRTIDFHTHSGKSGVPGVNRNDLHEIEVSLPSTRAEQEAIADALSDADALIESLEQLIAKKRQIKQGTMQALLIGKQRLPGFSESWAEVPIGEVADVKTGPFGSALHESDYVQSGTPIITVEHLGEFGITRQNLPLVSNKDVKRLSAYALEAGDIVFSRVGSIDRNALVSEDESGWLFSGRLLRVRVDISRVFAPYLSFQFHTEHFRNLVLAVAVGQTMASLNTKILKDILVVLPALSEQIAIANMLTDMDNELVELETRLAKTRQLKQGMMQELLTGRIRLV